MKKRDTQILIHVATPLKATIEALAQSEGRTTSDYVRRLLIDHALERDSTPDNQPASKAA
jgi:predicted DNA-binding protein